MVYWNDTLMDAGAVGIPIGDHTFLRGEGVFETIRAKQGGPVFWRDHAARLSKSAERLFLSLPEEGLLRGRIEELLEANRLRDARVRITLGENCLITAAPLQVRESGVKLGLRPEYPINERSPLAGIKCTSYAENMTILRSSQESEVLRPNTRGELCEACHSNVFFRIADRLFTPSLETGCLPGVMRKQVLARTSVEEGVWPYEMIKEAEEIWLSNSINKLCWAESLDGEKLAKPSALFHELRSTIP